MANLIWVTFSRTTIKHNMEYNYMDSMMATFSQNTQIVKKQKFVFIVIVMVKDDGITVEWAPPYTSQSHIDGLSHFDM